MRNYIIQTKLIFPEETYNYQIILKYFLLFQEIAGYLYTRVERDPAKKVEYELGLIVFCLRTVNLSVKIKRETF